MNDRETIDANTQYFATLPADRFTKEALRRVEEFDKFCLTTGRTALWSKAYVTYNKACYEGGRLVRVGEQGEYTKTSVNHFRNLITHLLNMTTSQPPVFECRSSNTDFKSQGQTIIANNVCEYYNRSMGMGAIIKQATEDALVFQDGYVFQGWDFSAGRPLMANPLQQGRVIKEGDVFHKTFTPIDVIFDFTAGMREAERQWVILRDFKNKWDLIAQYPQFRDKIMRLSSDSHSRKYVNIGYNWNWQTDYVPVFHFIHDRTESVPDGRMVTFMSDDLWLDDTSLPPFYQKLPVHRICASLQRGSGFGYIHTSDLLPLQDTIDGLYSTIITNITTFGVQNILMPSGSNISVQELTDGLNVIQYDPKLGKPEALSLVANSAETYQFLEKLEKVAETLSGVNSVQRGNPEASLKSGTALALVQSMALQFITGLQRSYTNLIEDLGLGLVNILKANAKNERMVEIIGKNNRKYLSTFKGEDLSSIVRVTVDFGNPVARTTAGRVNMADQLLQAGMVQNPSQYIQVLETGRIEPMIEGQQAELMLIRDENEKMSESQPVQAIFTDNHPLHIQEHKSVLASVEGRQNPAVVQVALSHIQEHMNLQNPPMPPAITAPTGVEGAGAAMPPVGAPEGLPQALQQKPPLQAEAEKVRLPNLPKNPLADVLQKMP